jgi:hypothetical protein
VKLFKTTIVIWSEYDPSALEGEEEVELPAHEMLDDMLLETRRTPEAVAEFEKSLQVDPNRFNGLYGAGIAQPQRRSPRLLCATHKKLRRRTLATNGTHVSPRQPVMNH